MSRRRSSAKKARQADDDGPVPSQASGPRGRRTEGVTATAGRSTEGRHAESPIRLAATPRGSPRPSHEDGRGVVAQRCDIVLGDRADEVAERLCRGEPGGARSLEEVTKPVLPELLPRQVARLRDTVRVQQQPVARLEVHLDKRHVEVGTGQGHESERRCHPRALGGDGPPLACLLGADGRQSTCRSLGAFRTRRWTYPQSALVASIAHSRPHHGVSTELHRPAGPLTTVPLPDNASSIVWVEQPAEAERLAALDDRDFVQTLHGRLQGFLGRIEAVGPRRVFPLEGLVAEPAAQGRIALAGESLHAFPPIGAQGLNLGFRDVASLLDALADARHEATDDPGHPQVAQAYARDRKIDIEASVLMVDMLDRSLFSGLLPLQLLRGAGLHLAKASPALRRSMMRKGMSPAPKVPRLMREAIDSESSDHA